MAGCQEQLADRNAVIFVIPYKIQRKRLEDMKNSMLKKNIIFSNTINNAVTHVVTEFENLEQVEKHMAKDGVKLPERAKVVSTKWLVECLKASQIVPMSASHLLNKAVEPSLNAEKSQVCLEIPEWSCQRGAGLEHFNKPLTDALEVLQLHAELRDANQDYPRALAFRRASCVLKSLPFMVKKSAQLDGLKDIGGHIRRVIMDILEHGSSYEVEEIATSQWFQQMKTFTSIFGVGPATAKNWISKGWKTIEDVRQAGNLSGDWRMSWGLAFYEDLATLVSRQEADTFTALVQNEANKILPGTIVVLTGGFRRGKQTGHDVDLLITHPEEGLEVGLLSRLLGVLANKNLVLIGHREKNSYRPDILHQDSKTSMRGQLDHFEKWLGICKFPKSFQDSEAVITPKREENQPSGVAKSIRNSFLEEMSTKSNQKEQSETEANSSKDGSDPSRTDGHLCGNFDVSFEEMYEPQFKKSKISGRTERCPSDIAKSKRNWVARRVDLIVSSYSQYYFALFGWTGSKHFNRDTRLYAQKVLGMKLTSHGLYNMKQQLSLSADSEEDVFTHLKIPYREPADRNC